MPVLLLLAIWNIRRGRSCFMPPTVRATLPV